MTDTAFGRRPGIAPGWVLAAALFGISVASPLVRLSSANALAIAAGRLAFSLVITAVFLVATGEWRQWRGLAVRDWALAAGTGSVLAFHFWSWNASVQLTTIAASTTLCTSLQPGMVALLSYLFIREAPTRRQIGGLVLAMLGALVITAPDLVGGGRPTAESAHVVLHPLAGNLLALGAGIAASIYLVVGRHLRARLGAWAYTGIVYGAALVTLLVIAGASGVPVSPQPPREMLIFLALAVGPMLLGHTGMNWALEHLPAYVVNLTMLGEPIGATILGMLLPGIHEIPPWTTFAGGAVVLAGVLVTAWTREPVAEPIVENA